MNDIRNPGDLERAAIAEGQLSEANLRNVAGGRRRIGVKNSID